MKKFIFILTILLMLLCSTGITAQIQDVEEWTRKELVKIVNWLYDNFEDFDRECFLTGTLDDSNGGHYQIFTANRSMDEIDSKVKWLFGKDLKFVPDTMRRQRITAYGNSDILTLFVITLFKNDCPDLRALRVCSVRPFVRYYGSEVKTADGNRDPVCNSTTDFDIELFSPSLAKTVAGYYNFDDDNVLAVSSGGDIGYRGVINKEKIATEAQKKSFLAGVFLRYGWIKNPDGVSYSIQIPDSFSTAKECVDILKEFGCDNVRETPTGHIAFNASNKIRDFIFLINDLFQKISGLLIVY
ncbi:MAG: hypothetical protein LBM08_06055 [Dysgonamonadaceae bacterium]|jgi:hypothetical protein|nr:hypothetical protein [Dysgonamonadaceae bacterium]